MSEEKTTYKGFSVGDRVYYYKKGCCPSLPSCLIGAILKIQTGKESATFVVPDKAGTWFSRLCGTDKRVYRHKL